MLTNIDLEKMNHLMETNKDAKEIITQLLKNHDAAVATIAHEIRNPMTVLYSSMQLMSSLMLKLLKVPVSGKNAWMAPDICVIYWMI